jgi:arylsulfatase A-like enzyme
MKLNKSLISALIALIVVPALMQAAAPQPNIVHIFVDDLGWQDIASHKIDGQPVYETPHLDQLTRDGLRFTQAYSPAPTCAPSRAAFLRGQHPINTGVYHVTGGRLPRPWHADSKRVAPYYNYGIPVEEPMIPESLSQAGYTSGHVGKWHAGGKHAGYPFPLDQGFDFGFTEKDGRHKYYNDPELWRDGDAKNNFFGSWGRMHPDRLVGFPTNDPSDPYRLNEGGRPFDKPHDLALGFMEQNKDTPFFLNYCPYYVHGPIQARNRERLAHYSKKMGLEFPTDPEKTYYDLPGHSDPYYASMVDELDWMVGDIVRYLEATDDPRNPGHKLIDNTYLIVDSDNGGVNPYTVNAPLTGGKQTTWEGGIRIPFLVRGPGVPVGRICETPINLIDLYPTFMEMAGLETDPVLELDGANILPLFHGETDAVIMPDGSVRETLFWYFPWDSHMSAAIRQGDWKLVKGYGAWMGSNAAEDARLFRLYQDGQPNDIGETKDLSDQYPEIRNRLLEELEGLIDASDANLPYRNATGKVIDETLAAAVPAVLELGSEQDQVWVTVESGADKAEIVEAQLFYTLNSPQMDTVRGHREEWFAAPAMIREGRVEATMPAGATHACFSMTDANGFLINSEELPAVTDVGYNIPDSELVKDGYAFKPGLYALIKMGEQAAKSSGDNSKLIAAISSAKTAYAADSLSDEAYGDAIRTLRGAIRNQTSAPDSKHPLINRFPTDPRF